MRMWFGILSVPVLIYIALIIAMFHAESDTVVVTEYVFVYETVEIDRPRTVVVTTVVIVYRTPYGWPYATLVPTAYPSSTGETARYP